MNLKEHIKHNRLFYVALSFMLIFIIHSVHSLVNGNITPIEKTTALFFSGILSISATLLIFQYLLFRYYIPPEDNTNQTQLSEH